jgi:hypothetical protein
MPPKRWTYPTFATFLLGCAWLMGLMTAVPRGVFFSGDGGLKFLMVQQVLVGRWVAWLDLPQPSWMKDFWASGLYPFQPPFVQEISGHWYPSFDWLFPAATAPFVMAFGNAGLLVLPAAGVVGTWIEFEALARRLRVRPGSMFVSLSLLVFACPLAFYGAVFWEHAPAVALSFWGFADALTGWCYRSQRRAYRCGLVLGLAGWLRPELVVFGFAAIAASWTHDQRGRVGRSMGAFAAVLLLHAVWNRASCGHWLGVHALQVVDSDVSLQHRLSEAFVRGHIMLRLLLESTDFCWVAFASTVFLIWFPESPNQRRIVAYVAIVVSFTIVGVACIVPNWGGLQIGPRYLLGIVPVLAVPVALAADRLTRMSPRWAILLGIVWSCHLPAAWHNVASGTGRFVAQLEDRILPSIAPLSRYPEDAIIFGHHWAAMEMASACRRGRPIATVTSPVEVRAIASAAFDAGHSVLLVDGPEFRRLTPPLTTLSGGRLTWEVVGERGEYVVLRGTRPP